MLQRPDYSKKYYLKIVLLIVIGAAAELIIWWTMVREESVDWIGKQVLDQPYAYAITEIDDGRIVVGNVVEGFEVTLPSGFVAVKTENPGFLYKEDEQVLCRVESNVNKYKRQVDIDQFLDQDDEALVRTYAGITPAIKKESTALNGDYIYDLQIPVGQVVVQYILTSSPEFKNKCRSQFEQIRMSFIYYE